MFKGCSLISNNTRTQQGFRDSSAYSLVPKGATHQPMIFKFTPAFQRRAVNIRRMFMFIHKTIRSTFFPTAHSAPVV